MRKLLLTSLLLIWASTGYSQWWGQTTQYFDGADTLAEYSVMIHIDSASSIVWHIGQPQKVIFDDASTFPNVLVTDTINHYPILDTSRVIATFPDYFNEELSYGILAIQWNQKLDIDTLGDAGLLEFTVDSGVTWQNAFDNPYVYSIYGFEQENLDTVGLDTLAFMGVDSAWKNIWFCFEAPWIFSGSDVGDFQIRFTLFSDSIGAPGAFKSGHEGWMIDNILAGVTYFHTVEEKPQVNYLEVYPNPVSNRLNIQVKKLPEYHLIEKLDLINSAGQVVVHYDNIPTRFFIDVGEYPPGAYFLKVRTNLQTETIPVIIQGE